MEEGEDDDDEDKANAKSPLGDLHNALSSFKSCS